MPWLLSFEVARRLSAATGAKIIVRGQETHDTLLLVRQSIADKIQNAPPNIYKLRVMITPVNPSDVPDGT